MNAQIFCKQYQVNLTSKEYNTSRKLTNFVFKLLHMYSSTDIILNFLTVAQMHKNQYQF